MSLVAFFVADGWFRSDDGLDFEQLSKEVAFDLWEHSTHTSRTVKDKMVVYKRESGEEVLSFAMDELPANPTEIPWFLLEQVETHVNGGVKPKLGDVEVVLIVQ